RLAAAGLTQEVQDLVALDKLQLRQGEDPVAVERGLKGEVEAGQGFDAGQASHFERRLDAPAFTQRKLLAEKGFDCFERANLAAFELAYRVIEDFERPRHFEPDQVMAHLIDRARHRIIASHARSPSPARRRATAS